MKCIISCLLIVGLLGNVQAQSEFEVLLAKQQEYQQAYAETPKPANKRKLHKAEDQLMGYLKEQGYGLSITLQTLHALPLYNSTDPTQAVVIDSLQSQQEITLYAKDQYDYYKVQLNGKVGYVRNLDQYLASLEEYPLALVEKYAAMQARVDAMLNRSINNVPPRYNSVACSGSFPNGKACHYMTRNTSGRCQLHE